ncbi:MAG: hypothetical protein WB679_07445 [Terracidiphilus sp.]
MSEKMYIRLLRMYPSRFRKTYEGEALQLVRDRLRDETGFFNRLRLWWDLLADLLAGLPRAYLNSYATPEAASLSPHAESLPSFKVLDTEPLGRGSIMVAGVVSLTAIAAFGFVLSRPIAYLPISGSNGKMSPIESVLERLNRATTSDSAGGGHEVAASSATTGAREQQTQSLTAAAPIGPETGTSAPALANRDFAGGPDRVVPMQTQNPNGILVNGSTPSRALETLPETNSQQSPGAIGNLPAHGLTTALPSTSGYSQPAKEHARVLIPAGQPRLENASSAMIRLFQTHDIVMFGEVHSSQQEYQWLCKLVQTPGFSDHVDDIVVEFGNALDQKTVDRYVAGEAVPFDEVQKAWRDMVADAEPASPVYGWLYKAVREANMQHPGRRGIRLLMGSPPGDWSKIRNSGDLAPYAAEREQWYANVVKTEVLAKHHRALLIMGAGHFLRGHDQALQFELAAQLHRNIPLDKANLGPGYIEKQLRAEGANPYLVVFGTNAIDNHGDMDRRFDTWPAPVLVPLRGNWVGTLPAQPVISGGHAPAIPLTLADQADALLYVAPCSALKNVYLSKADLDGTPYGQEVTRRDIILLGHPAAFPYGVLSQCAQPQQAPR